MNAGLNRLAGKVAVVTGSTSGIGRTIAAVMAREGAQVVLSGRRADKGDAEARNIGEAGGRAVFVQTDVSREDDCRRLMAETQRTYGGLDILVNNAGIFPRANLDNATVELWDRIFAINVRGAFLCCKYAAPLMRERGGGVIINIGSGNAYVGGSDLLPYSCSKGALRTMTHNLARALARDRIRVNWITVGWVASEGEIELHTAAGRGADWLHEQGKHIPLGRLQTEEEIAHAAVFLASDEACQITGIELGVDGGLTVGR